MHWIYIVSEDRQDKLSHWGSVIQGNKGKPDQQECLSLLLNQGHMPLKQELEQILQYLASNSRSWYW